ncbi:MAG: response regulator [Bdellovibrionales bacterium]
MSAQEKLKILLLIIDDEADICDILSEILSPHFDFVETTMDSTKASEMIVQNEYDLILSDIMMPNLLGSDLIRKIRGHGILTPVVFITGQATKETLMAGIRLGVADIIEKPFDNEILISSVRRLIEVEKRRTELVLAKSDKSLSKEQLEKKQKMIGLFLVAAEKQKAG